MSDQPSVKVRGLGQRPIADADDDRRADRKWRMLRRLALADRLPKKYYV